MHVCIWCISKYSAEANPKPIDDPKPIKEPNRKDEPKFYSSEKQPLVVSDMPSEKFPETQNPALKDRWQGAFEQLREENQAILGGIGLKNLKSGSMKSSTNHLVTTVEKK
jgi:hypothetical protein